MFLISISLFHFQFIICICLLIYNHFFVYFDVISQFAMFLIPIEIILQFLSKSNVLYNNLNIDIGLGLEVLGTTTGTTTTSGDKKKKKEAVSFTHACNQLRDHPSGERLIQLLHSRSSCFPVAVRLATKDQNMLTIASSTL